MLSHFGAKAGGGIIIAAMGWIISGGGLYAQGAAAAFEKPGYYPATMLAPNVQLSGNHLQ